MLTQPKILERDCRRVVIVDDDDLFRESLGLNLAEEGYEVVDFDSGEGALDYLLNGEVRNAIRYVLSNAKRHGVRIPSNRPDPLSSGPYFDGWTDFSPASPSRSPVARARHWLLCFGWQQRGLLHVATVPAR